MDARVGDILAALDVLAPTHLAEDWDNVGLQLGSRDWPVKRVMTALDPTPAVIREVQDREGHVLVTHHPLIFSPLRALDLDTPLGRILEALFARRIAVIAAHTNLDAVRGGVNDVLASYFPLEGVRMLSSGDHDREGGLGRVGHLANRTSLAALAASLKARMELPHIRFAGNPQLPVQRVALCSGSGSSMIGAFLESDADVFVTGDVRYHDAREIEGHGRGVIDVGHYESEHIILDVLTQKLAGQMASGGLEVCVEACVGERPPFEIL